MPIAVTREEAIALRVACQSSSTEEVVARSGRSLSTVWRAVNNPLPSALARRTARPVSPGNEPRAIAHRVYGIYGGVSIDTITRAGLDAVRQRLNRDSGRDGQSLLQKSTFKRKWPAVAAILGPLPDVSFVNPRPEDLADVASRIKRARVGAHVRVGSYALTSRAIVLALVGLSARGDAVIKVLYDKGWLWSCPDALEGLVQLHDAGIETRHLRADKVHMKAVCIDEDYCFSGSANHGKAGFGRNCELNTRVEGICCEDACKIFDGFYHGKKATTTTASTAAKMTNAAASLRARAAERKKRKTSKKKRKRSNNWSSASSAPAVDDSGDSESDSESGISSGEDIPLSLPLSGEDVASAGSHSLQFLDSSGGIPRGDKSDAFSPTGSSDAFYSLPLFSSGSRFN